MRHCSDRLRSSSQRTPDAKEIHETPESRHFPTSTRPCNTSYPFRTPLAGTVATAGQQTSVRRERRACTESITIERTVGGRTSDACESVHSGVGLPKRTRHTAAAPCDERVSLSLLSSPFITTHTAFAPLCILRVCSYTAVVASVVPDVRTQRPRLSCIRPDPTGSPAALLIGN